MGVIRECGGKMHLSEGDFEKAYADFFEAFKCYDESGSPRRIACLKYLVLSTMLVKSSINPFDSQEAKPYRLDPEIVAMTSLIAAYQRNDLDEFQQILRTHERAILDDSFAQEYIAELLRNVRSQVVVRLIKPFTRVRLDFVAAELRIGIEEAEAFVGQLILDGVVRGHINQPLGLLELTSDEARRQTQLQASLLEWASATERLVALTVASVSS